ncbi:MAG: hypothetical protein ACRC6X_05065, partial [Culicoidibacterales bacterium]
LVHKQLTWEKIVELIDIFGARHFYFALCVLGSAIFLWQKKHHYETVIRKICGARTLNLLLKNSQYFLSTGVILMLLLFALNGVSTIILLPLLGIMRVEMYFILAVIYLIFMICALLIQLIYISLVDYKRFLNKGEDV